MTQRQTKTHHTTVQAIKPHTHEVEGFLQYTENNLTPYYELGKLIEENGEDILTDIEFNSETYHLEISKKDESGLKDPNRETSAYEIKVEFERQDSVGEKSGKFWIRPRFNNAESTDSNSPDPSIPDVNDGQPYFTVQLQASNLELNEYQPLLQCIFDRFNIEIDAESHHDSSTVYSFSQEVRLDREVINPLIGPESLFTQLRKCVPIEDHCLKGNGEATFKRLGFDSDGVSKLFDGHVLGKSLKLYTAKNPPDNPENPLHHPKLCVTLNDENVYWDNITDAKRELNEFLINVLAWADLRIRENERFISDAYFTPEDTTHDIDLIENPLPELEKNQQTLIQQVSLNPDSTESQIALLEVLDELEQTTVNEITERIDYSQRTVYRCLDALHELVTVDNGSVSFATECLQTGLSSLLSKAKRIAKPNTEQRNKFQLWKEAHDVDTEREEGRLIMRFGEIGDNSIDYLLRQGLDYWTGEDRLFKFAKVTYVQNGKQVGKAVGNNFR
jgi:hypothetical protein